MQGIDRNTCRNIAYALLFCYFSMNAGLFFLDLPIGNRETVGRSAATLENLLLIMAGFFYGSSMGSRAKDKNSIDPEAGPVHTKQVETTKLETETRQEVKP